MSVSCSDCFSNLLCGEDSSTVFSSGGDDQPECSSEIESQLPPEDLEESITVLIEHERDYVPAGDYLERFHSRSLDASVRAESIAWILKVQRYYGFQPLTAYLSVNYFDRVLCSRSLPQTRGWPMQLLSVACLSLAAKMEEPLVPSLLDLQVEGAKYIFEPRTVIRMEFLVLNTLDWRLRSITPFSFMSFFAYKVDPTGAYTGFLISRASDIILSHIQDASFLEYWPSCIAAATILCAARDLPTFSFLNPDYAESWCEGLQIEKMISCYHSVEQIMIKTRSKKASKFLPQLRIMSRMNLSSSESSSSTTTSSSSSSSSSSHCKRRRINNYLWTDDDKEST